MKVDVVISGSCPSAEAHLWQNVTLKVLIGTFQSIQRTTICWAWNGSAITSSIWLSPLGYIQHPSSFVCCRLFRVDPQTQLWFEFPHALSWWLLDIGSSQLPVCQNNIHSCIWLLKDWHIPLHPDTLEGPSTCLTVLGMEWDSLTLQACLLCDKFEHIGAPIGILLWQTALYKEGVGISYWHPPSRV